MAGETPQPRLDPRLARRLHDKKARLDACRPLPAGTVARLYADLRVLLTYNSNALEGNTLSLRETQLVIEHGITVGGHPLRELLEATNHAEAFARLTTIATTAEPLTRETILTLHRLVMQTIMPDAGAFRTVPVYIRGARLTPPPASRVPALMDEWIAWIRDDAPGYDPLVAAVIAHHGFEAVHPFADGNGRVGRLLLNLLLMRAGYPPALLLREWRLAYVRALSAADTGKYTPLANLVGRAVEGGLDLYLEACAAMPEEELYQPLAALARSSGYSAAHLGWLVRQGRLHAIKRGGRWYSTPEAIARYAEEVAHGVAPRGRPPQHSGGTAPETDRSG